MIFIYNEKNYSVNVKNVFDEAKSDDYMDALDAGVSQKQLILDYASLD